MTPLLLPAVQHQLVQRHRAAHRCRQPVALLDRQNHLERQLDVIKETNCGRWQLEWNLLKLRIDLYGLKVKYGDFDWVSYPAYDQIKSQITAAYQTNTVNPLSNIALFCITWICL